MCFFGLWIGVTTPSLAQNDIQDTEEARELAQESKSESDLLDEQISQMTLAEKVGQLLIVGFKGTKLSPDLKRHLTNLRPGAIITFKRNIKSVEQIATLNLGLQNLSNAVSKVPYFIMVDQEGGSVTRIKTTPGAPSALAIGQTESPELAQEAGHIQGQMLKTLGFTNNLAPVADISNPNIKNFLGNRSFGATPKIVSEMSSSFAEGLSSAGILPTFKHFPGHGGLVLDSHKTLPKKDVSLEQLMQFDLAPFRNWMKAQTPSAIMVAHVAFPKVDPSGRPATFSHRIVQEILRQELQYTGLIITDDIEMSGADVGTIEERAVLAIEAGCDMVMVAWTPEKQTAAFRGLLSAAESGRLSETQIDERVKKILAYKAAINPPAQSKVNLVTLRTQFKNFVKQIKRLAIKISNLNMRRGLRKFPNLNGLLTTPQKVYVFSADQQFYRSFRQRTTSQVHYVVLRPNSENEVVEALHHNPEALGIYYATGLGSARKLAAVPKEIKNQLIVVNADQPGVVVDPGNFKGFINIFSQNYLAGEWLAEYLSTKTPPSADVRTPSSQENTN